MTLPGGQTPGPPGQTARSSGLSAEDLIPDQAVADARDDAFSHGQIAGQVAELVAAAATPVNIALYGPWGSGKSSFYGLLRSELKRRAPEVKTVRYDAWKYGGTSLKRNFIRHVASELGEKDSEYDRGLYEKTQFVRFRGLDFRKVLWQWFPILTVVAAVATGVLVVTAFFASLFSGHSFLHECHHYAEVIYGVVVVSLFTGAGLLQVLQSAQVSVEQAAPSEDEQFATIFGKLVKEVTGRSLLHCGKKSRLLVFIDELDRCAKEDVVSTLSSIRTFLDQDGCVFIVAADREVLEEALSEIQQTVPVRRDDPYYSSASAFLDKIFQHQVALPPLRSSRLTRFGRDLVANRGGVWEQLRLVQPRDRRLNEVLFALIPAHVRSPRRVKVLLNNFATNVRVAEARGIDWMSRATELAKLTVLQTEFPVLAADLHQEPHLPSFLLGPPDRLTDKQRELIARHSLEPERASLTASASPLPIAEVDKAVATDSLSQGEVAEPEPPDRLISGKNDHFLLAQQRQNLSVYLRSQRRVGVPDPGRDLLYLEGVGAAAGLADSELEELIETSAPSEPEQVISELIRRPVPERIAAARVLAGMAAQEFGLEQSAVITALAGAFRGLRPSEIQEPLDEILDHVRGFTDADALAPEDLPGLLVAAVADASSAQLRATLLGSLSLTRGDERLADLIPLLDQLSDDEAKPIEEAVGAAFGVDEDLLLQGLRTLGVEAGVRLMRSATPSVIAELRGDSGPEAEEAPQDQAGSPTTESTAARQLADHLTELGEPFSAVLGELLGRFASSRQASLYLALRGYASAGLQSVGDTDANVIALRGLQFGPAADWEFWSRYLTAGCQEVENRETVLQAIMSQYPAASTDQREGGIAAVQAIVGAGPISIPDPVRETLRSGLASQLDAGPWFDTDEGLSQRRQTYRLIVAMSHVDGTLVTETMPLLSADLRRALEPRAVPAAPGVPAGATEPATVAAAENFARLSVESPPEVQREAISELASWVGTPESVGVKTAGVLMLIGSLGPAATELLSASPTSEDVVAMLGSSARDRLLGFNAWLSVAASSEEVFAVLSSLAGFSDEIGAAIGAWAEHLDRIEGTDLWLRVANVDTLDTRWLEPLASGGLDSVRATEKLTERLVAAPSGTVREQVLRALETVSPSGLVERKLMASAALTLLSGDASQNKVEYASKLTLRIGEGHGLKGQLTAAIERAAVQGKLSGAARTRFERAGLFHKSKSWIRRILGT